LGEKKGEKGTVPFFILNIDDKKGCLKKGSDADIVILDRKLNVKNVFLKGKIH
jgi:N-acetylglucosamine-6-phosphate deacetylase